jgi:membrane-bound lytic murein transglycosylase D
MLIKPGSTLLVPRSVQAQVDVTSAVADRGEVSFAPEIVQVRKLVKAAKGDSVATIAKRYASSPANVAQWNKVAANASFKVGQSVVVYVPMNTAKPKAGSAKTHAKSTNRPAPKKTKPESTKKAKL